MLCAVPSLSVYWVQVHYLGRLHFLKHRATLTIDRDISVFVMYAFMHETNIQFLRYFLLFIQCSGFNTYKMWSDNMGIVGDVGSFMQD